MTTCHHCKKEDVEEGKKKCRTCLNKDKHRKRLKRASESVDDSFIPFASGHALLYKIPTVLSLEGLVALRCFALWLKEKTACHKIRGGALEYHSSEATVRKESESIHHLVTDRWLGRYFSYLEKEKGMVLAGNLDIVLSETSRLPTSEQFPHVDAWLNPSSCDEFLLGINIGTSAILTTKVFSSVDLPLDGQHWNEPNFYNHILAGFEPFITTTNRDTIVQEEVSPGEAFLFRPKTFTQGPV